MLAVKSSKFHADEFSTNSLHNCEPVSVEGGREGAPVPWQDGWRTFLANEKHSIPGALISLHSRCFPYFCSSVLSGSYWAHPCDRWDCWGQGRAVWVPGMCKLAEVPNPSAAHPNPALTSALRTQAALADWKECRGEQELWELPGAPFGFGEGQLCERPRRGRCLEIGRNWSIFSLRWGWPGWVACQEHCSHPRKCWQSWGWTRHYGRARARPSLSSESSELTSISKKCFAWC